MIKWSSGPVKDARPLTRWVTRPLLKAIRRVARRVGTPVYLVGGPLRDALLGRPAADIDIAVEGDSTRFGKALARELHGTFKSYRRFGTGTVAFKGSEGQVDVARARTETYASPAALPRVRAADIRADLRRRDFTINAMAYPLTACRQPRTVADHESLSPDTHRPTLDPRPLTPSLIDPFNGLEDLRRGLIRALHEKSFEDDPTRIFRAVRFAVRFGFRIEPRTLGLMNRAIREGRLDLLSGKRVLAELELVMRETDSGEILAALNRMGVFSSLFGTKLKPDCLRNVARLPDSALRLLYLTSYLGARNWGAGVRDWPLTREQRTVLVSLKAYFRIRHPLLRAERPSRVFALLEGQARDALRIESALEPRALADKIVAFLDCYSLVKPALTGQDFQRMGIRPGPIYSELLNRLLAARLDGKVKTRDDEVRLVRRIMKDPAGGGKHEGRE